MSEDEKQIKISEMRLLIVRAVAALVIAVGLLLEFVDFGGISDFSDRLMFLGFGGVVATLILDPKMSAKK